MSRSLRASIGSLAALALACAACAPVDDSGGGSKGGAKPGASPTRKENVGTPADPGSVRKGGELVIALNAEPDTLDPTQSTSLVARQIFHASCEKLYDVDRNARIVPQLATALPKVSADGRTVTIQLRTGAKFSDGTPFDSAAVKTSLLRHRDLDTSARATELGPVESVETPAENTVVVHLERPFAPFTAALADRAGMVMSPARLKKLGDDFGNDPSCVGPFRVVERTPQNSVELEPDPFYYDKDRVHLDRITYRIITDAAIRAANLRSGDAHVADTVSTQDVPDLERAEGVTVLESQSLGYQGVTFNVGNVDGVGKLGKPRSQPYAKDARIRQAFSYAVDRKSLVKAVFGDIFAPACTPVSPASEYTTAEAQRCPKHDPKRAKGLLQQAGVKTPYKIEMLHTNTPDVRRLAQALQAMVEPAGFALELRPMEFSALLDAQDRGDFEILQLGWSGRVDPDGNITSFVATEASQNVAGYSDKALDDLLQRARESQDKAERAELYGKVGTRLQAEAPLVYLYRQRNLTGVSGKVKGVQTFPDGLIRVAFAGFAK